MSSSLKSRRARFVVGLAAALATTVLSSCSPHSASSLASANPTNPQELMRAGSPELSTAHIVDYAKVERAMARKATGDTAAKEVARITTEQRVEHTGDREDVLLVSSATYSSGAFSDTISMSRAGLRPLHERLRFATTSKDIRYEGNQLHETIQVADSAPRTLERHFAVPVFAWNQLDVLVRSLPLHDGYRAILPLYSEGDDSLEMDTVAVLKSEPAIDLLHRARWTVRFADPAIVSTYVIDTMSRRIERYDVIGRANGTHQWREQL